MQFCIRVSVDSALSVFTSLSGSQKPKQSWPKAISNHDFNELTKDVPKVVPSCVMQTKSLTTNFGDPASVLLATFSGAYFPGVPKAS